MTLFAFYTPVKTSKLEGIHRILSLFYPIICPLLLLTNNKIIPQYISLIWQ
jgi:hypothetical protein